MNAENPKPGQPVKFKIRGPVDEETLRGVGLPKAMTSRWLRAVLTTPIPDSPKAETLRLTPVALKAKAEGLTPDLLFTNSTLVDGSKEYLPFGETPKMGDAFYLACRDALSKPGVTLTLQVKVVAPDPPKLVWEYSRVVEAMPREVRGPIRWWTELLYFQLTDGTESLTKSGVISLMRPPGITKALVADEVAYWFRVRVAAGSYRRVPRVKRFQLGPETTLAEVVNAKQDIVVLADADFDPFDAVLNVGGEFVQVAEVINRSRLRVKPSFEKRHDIGSPVQRRELSAKSVAGIVNIPKRGETFINIDLPILNPDPKQLRRVLLVNDLANPEFVIVKGVEHREGVPDGWALVLRNPLRFDHQPYTGMRRVTGFFGFTPDGPEEFAQPFLPFGEQPGPANFFFFGTAEDFPGMLDIHVEVEPKVELAWEFLGASGWRDLDVISDQTHKLVQDGEIQLQFKEGESIIDGEVNGRRNYWIRTRIKSGNYGVPAELVPIDPADPSKGFKIKPGTGGLSPPVIRKLSVNYEAKRLCQVVTQNGFYFTNQTSTNENRFAPFCSVKDLPTPVHNE
ncbi:MAG: hypothetical protein AAB403_23240, partial [Planctomycetota bacterium]